MKQRKREKLERGILGTILLYQSAIYIATDYINESSFYSTKHKNIFSMCRKFALQNQPINFIKLSNRAEVTFQLLGNLQNEAFNRAQLPYYCFSLAEEAIRQYCSQLAIAEASSSNNRDFVRDMEQAATVFTSEEDLFLCLRQIIKYGNMFSVSTAHKFAEVQARIEQKAKLLKSTHGANMIVNNVRDYLNDATPQNAEKLKDSLKTILK